MTDIDYVKHRCGTRTPSFLEDVLTEAKALRAREFIEALIEEIEIYPHDIVVAIEEIKEERKEDEKR